MAEGRNDGEGVARWRTGGGRSTRTRICSAPSSSPPSLIGFLDSRTITHIDAALVACIRTEDASRALAFDSDRGLHDTKKCVTEMVYGLFYILTYYGCRSPERGLLLFGPPGTGKTMIGKAIAGEAKATFFLHTSKFFDKQVGMYKNFELHFTKVEHVPSRRRKTQFLIETEGFSSGNDQILLIGATNRPQELDEAAHRRLTECLCKIDLKKARAWIICNLSEKDGAVEAFRRRHNCNPQVILLEKDGLLKLSEEDIIAVCKLTEGYCRSDMKNRVKDASMGPLREALGQGIEITKLRKEYMQPVNLQDFENALQVVRPSVSLNEMRSYEEWNRQSGSLSM
ncbi:Vps4 C terminal oligomerization domain [Musa troglodytarum]|uniref:Vps4 C terminal oligomerization domain n=1 Tax=Musa troglodytarum TaxID=320322 RepID=A0A9E7KRQ3_9LILI|nr:Vps4 C terminal oligomerization domain [Musa troglodytarum]